MTADGASIRAGRASRDRLLAMLFVATLLHGLLILGITFKTPLSGGRGAPGLRVLLVSDRLPPAKRNATATYLAQRTQLGAGNTRRAVQPSVPALRPALPPGHRSAHDAAAPPGRPARGGAEQVLTTTGWSTRVTYRISSSPGTLAGVLAPGGGGALGARASRPARLQGPRRQLWVSPDTRSSLVAPYLVAWRRKVERIGTLNFPAAAREAAPHTAPIIEVAVASDGRLVDAQIRRSSGDPALDHAALAILRMASPFDPFPPKLARRYRVLRFTYEWQFQGGRVRGSVTAP
jgi:protein TonB